MAHGLGQVQGGCPLAVVGPDLVGGRAHPLRIWTEQAQLGLGIGNSDRLGRQPPRLVAGISAALESSLAWARVLTGHNPTIVSDPGSVVSLGAGLVGGGSWRVGVVVGAARSTSDGVGAAVVVGSLGGGAAAPPLRGHYELALSLPWIGGSAVLTADSAGRPIP